MRYSMAGCCDRGLQMPLWGCVNEGSACTTQEAIILLSLAPAPPGRRAADRVGRSSVESSPRKPDGERTGLAVWTSHRQTDGALVHLCCPSPGGHEEEVSWWEKKGDSAGGGKEIWAASGRLEASISDNNSTASGAAFPPGLEMPSRCHHMAKQVSQERRERRQISLQTGCMAFTCGADPASFSQAHAGEGCPAKRLFKVLGRGVCHLPLLLGTSPISGIVLANVVLTPHG